ncbi:glycosyltransferase family 4 protein [Ancylobacter sp. FA202]|uniref:glycosyltransferase family 4 protein n=1 Tax=Ancylobacter sp. FA202 TaxID=1111106 RepID=UPI00037417B6|nr:glycosyltransferase family 4 protein [Ancylobacter sp. FA202]
MSGTHKSRSRAVLLTHVLPSPDGVGLMRRGWRWACELAATHDLDIVLVTRGAEAPVARTPLPGALHVVHSTGPALKRRRLADWFEPDAAAAAALGALSGSVPARVLVFRFYLHDFASHLPPAWRAVAEMDCDDWESATRRSLAGLALRRGRWRTAAARLVQSRRYARLERLLLPSYRTIHLSAAQDATRLARLPGMGEVRTSPNLVVADAMPALPPPPAGGRTLLFVGALFYPPNEDAVLWFTRSVLPLLRRLVPDVQVIVAGRADASLRRRLAAHGITYAHEPADLRPLYAQATAVIAPVRGGGGTKLKVLEAWHYARPLVGTSHAVRGLQVEPGRHVLVADRAGLFALHCAALLTDAALAARIADEGERLLRAQYCLAPADDTPSPNLAPG